MPRSHADARCVPSPGLDRAPVLDRMCSHFVLALTMKHAGRFNLRRDWNNLLSLVGRHLVWPAAVLARLRDYLAILTYPIRVGTHFNTAFALILSLGWAEALDPALAEQIRDRSRHWFGTDRDCQAWEPGGDEFLSPALIEALCMARAHKALFPIWFEQFLPRVAQREPATLFTPAIVSDRSDGKIAHLDGLNLSRAWCWRSLAPLLPAGERAIAEAAADEHLATAMPHLAGDYMGEHWLASFALLALLC